MCKGKTNICSDMVRQSIHLRKFMELHSSLDDMSYKSELTSMILNVWENHSFLIWLAAQVEHTPTTLWDIISFFSPPTRQVLVFLCFEWSCGSCVPDVCLPVSTCGHPLCPCVHGGEGKCLRVRHLVEHKGRLFARPDNGAGSHQCCHLSRLHRGRKQHPETLSPSSSPRWPPGSTGTMNVAHCSLPLHLMRTPFSTKDSWEDFRAKKKLLSSISKGSDHVFCGHQLPLTESEGV